MLKLQFACLGDLVFLIMDVLSHLKCFHLDMEMRKKEKSC